jgi:hypothetical protein
LNTVTTPLNTPALLAVFQRFARDHERVRALADGLKTLLNGPPPSDVQVLASARWAFASALMQGLAIKERHIYAKLEQDARAYVVAFSNRSKTDLLGRFDAYMQHMQQWPTSRAVRDWPCYRPSAIAVVDAFLDRLMWEEKELFAFVDAQGIDIAMPAGATSNWVRKAFDVKNSVGKL